MYKLLTKIGVDVTYRACIIGFFSISDLAEGPVMAANINTIANTGAISTRKKYTYEIKSVRQIQDHK